MTPSIDPGPGCAIVSIEHELDGDTLHTDVTVRSDGHCRAVRVPLPGGATLTDVDAVEHRADGRGPRLDSTRWQVSARGPDGGAVATLHVPDLWSRDAVRVRLARRHVPEGVARSWADGQAAELPAPPPAAVVTRRARALRLSIPSGNLQMVLHPEGAASSHVDEELDVAAADVDRWLPLELPPGVEPVLRAAPAGAAELQRLGGVWAARVFASEAPARLIVSWDDPLCPTHGEVGDLDALTVAADGAKFQWDDDRWILVKVGDDVVLPNRQALAKALDRRLMTAAIPEPSAPAQLRHAGATRATLGELRPALETRAPTLPPGDGDPLFVRPFSKARKSGALTPTEAMGTLWLYARQIGFDASWVFVRPAPTETLLESAPDPLSPAGYDAPLLAVRLGDEVVFVDPQCGNCAPFELPPELEGARVLTRMELARTPPPTSGSLRVVRAEDTVRVEASGPPALRLRQLAAEHPPDARAHALAVHVGGPGARLVRQEGLEVAGAPIVLEATTSPGLGLDPTALPVAGDDGAWWFDWVGTRSYEAAGDGPVFDRHLVGVSETATVRDGVRVHVLEVTERRVTADPAWSAPPVEVSPSPPSPAPPSPTSEPSSP